MNENKAMLGRGGARSEIARLVVCGFALYLHDKDGTAEKTSHKAISTGTLLGEHVQDRPNAWSLVILSE